MELVKDLTLKGHGVKTEVACPKERAKPYHWLQENSVKLQGHSKALGTVGSGVPNSSDGVFVN